MTSSPSAAPERALHLAQQERPICCSWTCAWTACDVADVALEIRRTGDVPVLFLTAHSDGATLKPCQASNPDGFVADAVRSGTCGRHELALHRHHLNRELRASQRRYAATWPASSTRRRHRSRRTHHLHESSGAVAYGPTFEEAWGRRVDGSCRCATRPRHPIAAPDRRSAGPATVVRAALPSILVAATAHSVPFDLQRVADHRRRPELIGAVMAFRDLRPQRATESALKRVDRRAAVRSVSKSSGAWQPRGP